MSRKSPETLHATAVSYHVIYSLVIDLDHLDSMNTLQFVSAASFMNATSSIASIEPSNIFNHTLACSFQFGQSDSVYAAPSGHTIGKYPGIEFFSKNSQKDVLSEESNSRYRKLKRGNSLARKGYPNSSCSLIFIHILEEPSLTREEDVRLCKIFDLPWIKISP
jgi:hypothetical protein